MIATGGGLKIHNVIKHDEVHRTSANDHSISRSSLLIHLCTPTLAMKRRAACYEPRGFRSRSTARVSYECFIILSTPPTCGVDNAPQADAPLPPAHPYMGVLGSEKMMSEIEMSS